MIALIRRLFERDETDTAWRPTGVKRPNGPYDYAKARAGYEKARTQTARGTKYPTRDDFPKDAA